jgi:uncharacterized membrane protein YgdD (TMEM256/DUF423 family)
MNNPLIPESYDWLWTVMLVAQVALAASAIVSVVRIRSRVGLLTTVLWIVGILIFPFLGSLVWFSVGRRDVRRRSTPVRG